MGNFLVILMGIIDLLAGIIILISFNFTTLSIIFGILMCSKGIMSFSFNN